MKKHIAIFSWILILASCSKNELVTNLPGNSILKDPSNVISYDTLQAIILDGSIFRYKRIDSVFVKGWFSANVAQTLAAKHWNVNKKADTSFYFDVLSSRNLPAGIYYKDTSYETITVSTKLNLSQLDHSVSQYLRSKIPGISDIVKVSIWYINNTTLNTLDTQYLVLSPGSFQILPSPARYWDENVGSLSYSANYVNTDMMNVMYTLPLENSNISGYSTKLYSKADTSFRVNNGLYTSGKYILENHIKRYTGNGLINSMNSSEFHLATKYGILKYTGSYQYSNGGLDVIGLNLTRTLLL